MSTFDFQQLLDRAREATKSGIDIKGKQYTTVAQRIEIFRTFYADNAGIQTDIVQLGTLKGEPVVVKATIHAGGNVLATGHAAEVVGQGHINATSALENCETSAIGRALAALGIHGGEFASALELRDKKPNPSAEGLRDAWHEAATQDLSESELEIPGKVAEAYADQMRIDLNRYKTASGVNGWLAKSRDTLSFIERTTPEHYAVLKQEVSDYREALTK